MSRKRAPLCNVIKIIMKESKSHAKITENARHIVIKINDPLEGKKHVDCEEKNLLDVFNLKHALEKDML